MSNGLKCTYCVCSQKFDSMAVLKPGLRVPSHRVNDFGRVGSGRVTGQCDRPGYEPGIVVPIKSHARIEQGCTVTR